MFLVNSGSSKMNPEVGSWGKIPKRLRPVGSRRFHYSFELDGGHSGFVLHKKSRRKGRLRMFLDSNDNGLLDRRDQLLVRGILKKPFSSSRPGSLLRGSEDGVITAKVHVMDQPDHDHGDHGSPKDPVGINSIGFEHMSLWTDAMAEAFHDHGAAHHHDSMMM